MRTPRQIRDELEAHLKNGGTINDGTVDALYRERFRVPDEAETDLETVEEWAVYGKSPSEAY